MASAGLPARCLPASTSPDVVAMARLIYAIEAAPGHHFPAHPECPGRVEAIQQALQRLEVFAGCADGQVQIALTPAAAATAAAALTAGGLKFCPSARSHCSQAQSGTPPAQVTQLQTPPAQLPEGLLEAVQTAEHVAELQATSAGLSGPAAVRDPDDPGEARTAQSCSAKISGMGLCFSMADETHTAQS